MSGTVHSAIRLGWPSDNLVIIQYLEVVFVVVVVVVVVVIVVVIVVQFFISHYNSNVHKMSSVMCSYSSPVCLLLAIWAE
jgi:hypothetical protein